MIRSVQDVKEAHFHKTQSRLIPSWIEAHESGVSQKFKCANDAIGGHESQCCNHSKAEAFISRMDGKLRMVRLDGIIQSDVEHRLLPIQIGAVWQSRSTEVGHSVLVCCE